FGYRRYELSNFALPGYESLHNRIYWRREWYKGFGPSASSFIKESRLRYTNVPSISRYIREFPPPRRYDPLDEEAERMEIVFLGLRTGSLPVDWYVENYGAERLKALEEFLDVKGGRISVKNEYLYLFDAIVRRMV
ncbi:MAG: hypothetical protein GXO29_07305, partial [Thermotogae bacterium]|nr:hypothetical protein [Thermotogota bacterium]